MGLRFFADHCIPNSIIQKLLDAGHEVLWLKDHIPIESPGPIVIATAQRLDSILISLNGDFTDKLNYPPGYYKGIVALQVRNHPEIIPQLMVRLINYLSSYPDMNSYKGKLILVEVNRIRIRE
jgi:predicted nuclease of predicted toxin-antitoxin system